MERETEELPGSPEREPTLPLPRSGEASPRPPRGGRFREPNVLWVVLTIVAVAAAFFGGWSVGRNEERAAPPARPVEAAPPPTRDAKYCGRALDVAARVVQLYRFALENRAAATDAALDGDVRLLRRLERELGAMIDAADGLEGRMTRALASCPS